MIVSDLAILEALPGKLAALATMRAEVGVLEDTAPRTRKKTKAELAASGRLLGVGAGIVKTTTASDETNAEIGFRHEKGSVSGKLPRRSFLEDPMVLRGEENLHAHDLGGVIEEHLASDAVEREDVFERMAVAAEATIDGAFESGGYGTWPQLAPSTVARKGNDRILIESEQLRDSITHRIVAANR